MMGWVRQQESLPQQAEVTIGLLFSWECDPVTQVPLRHRFPFEASSQKRPTEFWNLDMAASYSIHLGIKW